MTNNNNSRPSTPTCTEIATATACITRSSNGQLARLPPPQHDDTFFKTDMLQTSLSALLNDQLTSSSRHSQHPQRVVARQAAAVERVSAILGAALDLLDDNDMFDDDFEDPEDCF